MSDLREKEFDRWNFIILVFVLFGSIILQLVFFFKSEEASSIFSRFLERFSESGKRVVKWEIFCSRLGGRFGAGGAARFALE